MGSANLYKKTEVGVIPKDWEVKKLGECTVSNPEYGINAPAVAYSDSLPTYLRISDIFERGGLRKNERVSVKCKDVSKYILSDGDLVFARTGASVGKTYLYNTKDGLLVFAGYLIRFRPNEEKLIPGFLKSYTETKIYRNWVSAMSMRSGQPGISGQEYSHLPIPLPPLQEQKAIAKVLSDVDELITSIERLIDKKQKIKQGTMELLLTGKKRLPGFSGEWEVKRLGEIADIRTGKRNNEDKIEDGAYPFFVRSQKVEKIGSYSYEGEAILVPGEGGIGEIYHYINGKFDYHQRVYKISDFSGNIFGKFAYYYMKRNFGNHAMKNTVKATVDSLRLPTFEGFVIRHPSLQEQKTIAKVLSDMDLEIDVLQEKLEKYRLIKEGMMEKLLTGKVRLNG